MYKTVELNGSALIMVEFHSIANTFGTSLDQISYDEENQATMRSKIFFAKIQRRLGVGSELPEIKGETQTTGKKAKFELTHDPPGWLSHQGPRHGNESDDIRNIGIMPTALETQSPRLEYYLPQIHSSSTFLALKVC